MLGEYYGKLLSNEVPDRFAKLLNELERAEPNEVPDRFAKLLNELERAEPGKMEATETKAED